MNWLRLRSQAICLAEALFGLYLLFYQESLSLKLLGAAIFVIGTMTNTIDGLALYLGEVEEKVDKLAIQSKAKADP